jgi:hypothetical protein
VSLLWATRGRTWGFRFLTDDGSGRDPLAVYEEAFARVGDAAAVVRRTGDVVAVRFPDPECRCDRAGRVIPHEFVVTGSLATSVSSVEDALEHVWPLVRERYAGVWDAEKAPSAA